MKHLVYSYLAKNDWKIKENANMSYSVQGLNNYIAGEVVKKYWLEDVYDQPIRDMVARNHINIHDMDQLSAYCVGHDIRTLLLEGFTGAEGKVESAPAKHFRTALLQSCNFIYTLQGETAGAQAFSNFDTYLAPFIEYDGLSYEEVKQSIQEFVFNLNVPTRVGFQTPFTNITLDLKCPDFMKNESVIIGGKLQDTTYGQYQEYMDIFNRAFLEVMNEGDERGRVFTFPIPTYNITDSFDWDGEITNLIVQSAIRYGIPTFSNFVGSNLNPDDVRSMCCRLRIDNTKLVRGGGQFGSAPLTGSIGVVTLNLPRIAYDAENDHDRFYKLLTSAIFQASRSLELKRKFVEEQTELGLYPYSKYYMKDVKLRTDKYWANHFSTIGVIGMNEALEMIGIDFKTEDGRRTGLRILHDIAEQLEAISKETGNLYNLEATPAEGTCYKLALKDKAECPGIVTQGSGDEVYYTNSTHLPHNNQTSLAETLDHQDELQASYTGGTTLPIYIAKEEDDIEATKEMIRSICDGTKIPYFSLVPVFSICRNHGYIKGNVDTCPTCRTRTEVYSKVVGFIRPIDNYNKGKRREFSERVYNHIAEFAAV